MDEFLEDLKSGEIQFRDRWQFEVKSEFSPGVIHFKSSYVQEFYFFIPNALHINADTYSKEEFYRDLTNIIRYKTPVFSLEELIDANNSPFASIEKLALEPSGKKTNELLQNELKLLGNIFRSALRTDVKQILAFSLPPEQEIKALCQKIQAFQNRLIQLLENCDFSAKSDVKVTFNYLGEFIGNSVDYYLTGLLDQLHLYHSPVPKSIHDLLCNVIIEESEKREKFHHNHIELSKHSQRNEQILYRASLLKTYFLDALALRLDKTSIQERYGSLISSFSAGFAMLIYLLLFVWQGQWFVINSAPFIILTVVAYVLKDRLKENLKGISFRRALMYFSDYTTKIRSPQEKVIGELKESFTFAHIDRVPDDIKQVRDLEFHSMLKTFKRPEQVIYFKRVVTLFSSENDKNKRLNAVNVSLHYNLKDFLEKASDPYHNYTTVDPSTKTLLKLRLPKVYHLNVIMKNTSIDGRPTKTVELKKFRIIVDKNGIKNIEPINA